jgi:Tol biopolymer transport system component
LIRKAKRSSAANFDGSGLLGSVFGRRAFATRGASAGCEGTGAPSSGSRLASAILLGLVFAMAFTASPASAAKVHPFKETFGSAAQPSLTKPWGLTVDQANGDILAIDNGANEKQQVEIAAASGLGGAYKLGFGGQSTGAAGSGDLFAASAGSGDLSAAAGTGTRTALAKATTGTRTALAKATGTRTALATGFGNLAAGSNQVTSLTTTGAFAAGASISGPGIPVGATIVSCSPNCASPTGLTLSTAVEVGKSASAAALFSGSKTITGLTGITGTFTPGESVSTGTSGAGIPVGTTIVSCSPSCASPTELTLSRGVTTATPGTAEVFSGSKTITGLTGITGTFTPGESISPAGTGTGIPAGTTLVSCSPSCASPTELTLSLGVNSAGPGEVFSGSKTITGVTTTAGTGAFDVGQAISGLGTIPAGTTIVSCLPSCGPAATSLTLSAGVISAGVGGLQAGSFEVKTVTGGPFGVGQTISGTGIPVSTTVNAVAGNTITLSKAATKGAAAVALSATASKTVSNVLASTGAFSAGESIAGTGVPAGATISAVAGNTLTLSAAATASGTGVSLAADLPFNASTTAVKEELAKLPGIGAGNVVVSEIGSDTAALIKRSIEFNSALGGKDVEAVSCDGSGLTGTSPTCAVTTTAAGAPYGIKRFNPDGTPANFSALGTNLIDGRKGALGKTCGEGESSSCDETPQANGLGSFTANASGAQEVQVAVDNSGGAANGDIYVTQTAATPPLIDIFAADGHYLGQLTKAGATSFGETCGVTVDEAGSAYLGDFTNQTVRKFVSQGAPHNPLVNTDNTANFNIAGEGKPCTLAAGFGPTSGSIFVDLLGNSGTQKRNSVTGALEYEIAPGSHTITATVNPADGHLLTASGSSVTEWDASGATEAVQTATLTAASEVQGVAVNKTTGNVYISRRNYANLEVYLPPASGPVPIAKAASGVTGARATLNGTVNPEFGEIEECKFEYLTAAAYAAAGNSFNGTGPNAPATASCVGSIPTDASPHAVSAALSGLTPQGTTYYFRLTAKNFVIQASSASKTFTTTTTVATEAATAIGAGAATLKGTVRNEEADPFTACVFEYLTEADYQANGGSYSGLKAPTVKDCTPAAASIAADFQPHAVSAALTGLVQNTTFHFRLVATNLAGTVRGEDQSFSTPGPPQVIGQSAGAQRTAAELLARVNPSGFATTYHFEWGTDSSYGTRIPADFDLFAGSGTSPVNLTASIGGLQESTTYHFHVLATNSAGTTAGPDQEFTTLGSTGLPDSRRFELVSPANKRPQGAVGGRFIIFLCCQVAEDGQSLLFPLLGGLADTDSGGDTSYLATRHESGWQSTKVSPPSLVPAPTSGTLGHASAGSVVYSSPDLSCQVINTFNPLTEDTPVADVELGVFNLYRRNPDGSHTLITSTVPANPGIDPIGGNSALPGTVTGASPDCGRIYFESPYQYLSDPSGFYEWDNGTLRDAGRLPNGAVPAGELLPSIDSRSLAFGGEWGANGASGSRVNSVSRDGSHFFFTALSNEGGDSGEPAVFVRKGPAETVDASQKQGGAKDSLGARYETASPDGSHVFFTANYGLTPTSSSGPTEDCSIAAFGSVKACDLYDYNVDTNQLKDLSANSKSANTIGAAVNGVVAVSRDGSSVYFAARGQLVEGKGKTYAQNTSGAGSANLYLARGGQLSYVATIDAADMGIAGHGVLMREGGWTSEATPDGDHLLFVSSSANVTGYDSGGVIEAYLYSADTGTTECVSCRPDGLPSVGSVSPLIQSFPQGPNNQSQPRKMSDDGNRVFFTTRDILAPGAVSGNPNLYEWEQGQVYLLASGSGPQEPRLYGASNSGDDVFFNTSQQLDPHDTDFVRDAYDARVGGGFPAPPPPPVVCDVASSECQGSEAPQPTGLSPASQSSSGEGNPALQAPPCPKGKVRRHGKCVPKSRHKAHHKRHSRAANTNRGGAK